MLSPGLLNLPCTIVRRTPSGETDDYGREIESETLSDTLCELQQQRRDEQGDQAETSDTTWLCVLPAGTDVRTGDAIVALGCEHEMVGDPWHARSPFDGQQSHVEATLRRTAGDEDAS